MSDIWIPNQNPEGGKTSLTKIRKDCEHVIKEILPHTVVQHSAEIGFCSDREYLLADF